MNIVFLIIWISVGWGVGFYLCRGYKKHVDIISELDTLVLQLSENIKHFKLPTSQLLQEYKFKTTLSKLLFSEVETSEYISEESLAEIKGLISEISVCSSQTAITKLELFKSKTGEMLEKAKKEYTQKGITYQKLGVLFGLLVGILWL